MARTARYVFPGFTWQLGFVLGAVVSTTDAIAATSIARRVGLPQRVVDILEGESLVNDASGLVALEFGLAMVMKSETPTVAGALLRLASSCWSASRSACSWPSWWSGLRSTWTTGPIEIAVSILVPFVAYLAAEAVHGSGVLAVVTCGLYLSRRSARFFSPQVRLQAWAVWDAMTFALNGLVFVLIGLQLPYVMAGIHSYSVGQLLFYGATFSALLIVLRLMWMYPGAHVAYFIRKKHFASGLHHARSASRFL